MDASTPKTTLSEMTLLVVDDNLINREFLITALHEHVLRVQAVPDGPQAIRHFEQFQADLVLMDLHMPGMDGLEVWQRICAPRGHPPCPVIALTADCRPEERERLIAAGFDGFLNKPVSMADLLVTIAEVCHLEPPEIAPAPESTLPGSGAHLPVIDRPRALATCNEDPTLVKKMQAMLLDELNEQALDLDRKLATGQFREAMALVHRWRGGCGYAGAIRLERACGALEQALGTEPKGINQTPGAAYFALLGTLAVTCQAIRDQAGPQEKTRAT